MIEWGMIINFYMKILVVEGLAFSHLKSEANEFFS